MFCLYASGPSHAEAPKEKTPEATTIDAKIADRMTISFSGLINIPHRGRSYAAAVNEMFIEGAHVRKIPSNLVNLFARFGSKIKNTVVFVISFCGCTMDECKTRS